MVNIKKTAQGQVFIFEAVVSQIHSAPLTLDVAITTHSKRAQRRSSPRFPVYQEIRYRRAGNEEGWLPARIWDLSAEGICIISAQKHEPEDKIIIEFTAVQKIYLVGVVRVCTAHKTGADAFALGVQFANLGNEKQKAIGRFLLENQIEKVRTAGSLLYHYTPRKPIIIPGRKSAPPA
jgi:c-di-GMP-binding flagellar brake protein YcgR